MNGPKTPLSMDVDLDDDVHVSSTFLFFSLLPVALL